MSKIDQRIRNLFYKMSGLYLMSNPLYIGVIKIGCSTNIQRRIRDSCYTTMYLDAEAPKCLGYHINLRFQSLREVLYVEKCVHTYFADYRCQANRELFTCTVKQVIKFLENFDGIGLAIEELPEIADTIENIPILDYKDYQEPILQQLNDFYLEKLVGKLILPCGFGKTHISLTYAKNYDRILFLVPSLLLLDQTAKVAVSILDEYSINTWSGENKIIELGEKMIIISTYQSIDQLDYSPDFVIYDEAHRTCVNRCDSNDSQFHNTVGMFPDSRKLFMTATEKICLIGDNKHYSMKDQVYGDYICKKTFNEAIDMGILTDYTICVPENDDDPVSLICSAFKELAVNHMLVYLNKCDDAKELNARLVELGVQSLYIDGTMSGKKRNKILKDFEEGDKTVLCSVNVLNEGIDIPCIDCVVFVDARTSVINITQSIGRALRLHPDKLLAIIVIPSSMLKNESLLTTLAVMDTRSEKKIVGFSGNGVVGQRTRHNLNTVVEKMKFINVDKKDMMWNYKYQLCVEYEKETNKIIIDKLIWMGYNIGSWITKQKRIYHKNQSRQILLNNLITIKNWLVNGKHIYINNWMEILQICIDFEIKYPGIKIKGDLSYQNINIGKWIDDNKIKFKKLSITRQNFLKQLQTINDWWNSPKRGSDEQFDLYLNACKNYEKTYPNTKIISKCVDDNGLKIGQWLVCRKRYLSSKNLSITNKTRLSELSELYTVQQWLAKGKAKFFDPWLRTFNLCLDFQHTNINIKITGDIIHKDVKIGRWLSHQRENYTKLTDTKKQNLLQILGIPEWLSQPNHKSLDYWMQCYDLCVCYEADNNKSIPAKNKKLYVWIQRQKRIFDNLTHTQQNLMFKLKTFNQMKDGFDNVTYIHSLSFDEYIKLITDYENEHNVLINKTTIYNNVKIGIFMDKNCLEYKYNKLDTTQVKKLENLTSWLPYLLDSEKLWLNMYQECVIFEQNNPKDIITTKNDKIYRWLSGQFNSHNHNKIYWFRQQHLIQLRSWNVKLQNYQN